MTPEICIIAALSENRVIGKDGGLPWPNIPEDMKHFKKITTPHPVIMGRKTWESIPDKFKPLPDRINIVVTHNQDFNAKGVYDVPSLDVAFGYWKIFNSKGKIFVMGGGEVYGQAIDRADRLYLTLVAGNFEGDTYFPDYSDFKNVVSEVSGESKGQKYKFLELTR